MSESIKAISELGFNDGADCLGFSSWCNFDYYGADFGWENPVWVNSIDLSDSAFINLIMLVDTRLGDSTEAWVILDKQDMALLVCNPDLIKLASIDPSPLVINNFVLG
ncbi:hypothetical protein RCOM_1600910 [Ricinus communis]|uniref:Uncharacterized protein n=1 Tax=Ricinus communis TaxID=3988 RepID=B9R8M2_RICCO|nr:hypothetical protein RCOM_1600910 [Ricinus communis]